MFRLGRQDGSSKTTDVSQSVQLRVHKLLIIFASNFVLFYSILSIFIAYSCWLLNASSHLYKWVRPSGKNVQTEQVSFINRLFLLAQSVHKTVLDTTNECRLFTHSSEGNSRIGFLLIICTIFTFGHILLLAPISYT